MGGGSARAPAVGATACAACAPLIVLAGSGMAAAAQPPGYDPVAQTFSALAKDGAADRWIMVGTLLLLGACYVSVAAFLPGVRPRGRVVLATGGAAVALAALLAQPADGDSAAHMVTAGIGWAAFTAWPLAAASPGGDRWSARGPAVAATVVLAATTGWFVVELVTGGPRLGLAQRIAVVAQTGWPLVVAVGRTRSLLAAGEAEPAGPAEAAGAAGPADAAGEAGATGSTDAAGEAEAAAETGGSAAEGR